MYDLVLVDLQEKRWSYNNKCQKLQFIHTVNGDGSKTAMSLLSKSLKPRRRYVSFRFFTMAAANV